MIKQICIEQLRTDEYRQIYNEEDHSFKSSKYKNLLFARGFKGHYGWIIGTGNPPHRHLDILFLTDQNYKKGDIVSVKIVGAFFRKDKDHKIVGIEISRTEDDLDRLKEKELENLKQIYPTLYDGEGWFGKQVAEKIVKEF